MMTTMPNIAFSTNESVSLEKTVEFKDNLVETKFEDIDNIYETRRSADWVKSHEFQKVCLQFPDCMLPDSRSVCSRLQELLSQTVYILGDTAYESCCIDYVAAAHINADAIIHYGPVCFSKTSGDIPYLNVYEKWNLDVAKLENRLCEKFDDVEVSVLLDSPYLHCLDDIVAAFEKHANVRVERIDEITKVLKNGVVVFVGKNERKLINIQLKFDVKELYCYDDSLKKYEIPSTLLKRRNYLIEKIKDSNTIGIVIGTLGVKNYLQVIERIKKLISLNSKKYYLISVGKPTVAKLANFPEMDIYVAVTCSMSEIYESRDFYRPIATPFDVEMALNGDPGTPVKFSYDYNSVFGANLTNNQLIADRIRTTDVSLLTNKIRSCDPVEDDTVADNAVALKSDTNLALNSSFGAGFLSERSWMGLEQNLGQTEVGKAQEGRTGVAQKYTSEQ